MGLPNRRVRVSESRFPSPSPFVVANGVHVGEMTLSGVFPGPASFRCLRLDQNQPYLPMSSALCHGLW